MANKNLSIVSAYEIGAKTVINKFSFFVMTMSIAGLICGLFLVFIGIVDYMLLKNNISALLKMVPNALDSFAGPIHWAGINVHDAVQAYVPTDLAQQTMGMGVPSVDVSKYDWMRLATVIIPSVIVVKMMLEVIAIGWAKVALDLNAKKEISYNYMYKFYYLAPRVFLVNFIVATITLIGVMLFILPGIFMFQRLRFARYFIIDKNLSIIKSLQASWALTHGDVISLFGFSMTALLLEGFSNILPISILFFAPLHRQAEANIYIQMISIK